MDCPECKNKMVMLPEVLLSYPPKYQYYCDNCNITKVINEIEPYGMNYIFNSEFRKGDTAFIRDEMIERKIISVDFQKNKMRLKGIKKWIDMKDIGMIARPYN